MENEKNTSAPTLAGMLDYYRKGYALLKDKEEHKDASEFYLKRINAYSLVLDEMTISKRGVRNRGNGGHKKNTDLLDPILPT